MSVFRLLCTLFAVLAVAPASFAQVTARLVALEKSIQPGKPVTVALELSHQKDWHTYWINPGTGYPTSLAWSLPEGWTAGEFEWPTPSLVKDTTGKVTGHGYEGLVLLPVKLTPPSNLPEGAEVTLKAKADWLMCALQCVPGNADVEVTLPVRNAAPEVDEATKSKLTAQSFPFPWSGGQPRLTREGANLQLRIPGAGSLRDPHIFSSDGWIAFDQPQNPKADGNDLLFTLAISPDFEGETDRLQGVLAYRDEAGSRRGANLDVSVSTGALQKQEPAKGLVLTLFVAFIGGLILNLMPCVFPVLGIKILGFVNQAGSDRRKVTLHGLVFALGVLVSFWSLAGLLAVLRAGGAELGWGFQLQSPAFVFAVAAGLLAFALSMSGVFEFGLGATGVGGKLQSKSGYAGSFFTGVLATIVATPCSAPFLAPALGAALAVSTVESFAIFTAIAVGLSLPYLLLSIFPQAVRVLPRPGAWMETFKEAMAFPLYATVGYLIWVLAGQLEDVALRNSLFGLVLVALGLWLYGRYHTFGASKARSRVGLWGGAAFLALGVWMGWPKDPSPGALVWQPWSAEAVAKGQADKQIIYVDFTARWCATCQTNKGVVFSSDEVNTLMREKNVLLLKADWTNRDPKITAELARFGRSAVPFNLVYRPGSTEPIILPELLRPGTVIDAINGPTP